MGTENLIRIPADGIFGKDRASFVFLLVFALVNSLAWHAGVRQRWLSGAGALASLLGSVVLVAYIAGLIWEIRLENQG